MPRPFHALATALRQQQQQQQQQQPMASTPAAAEAPTLPAPFFTCHPDSSESQGSPSRIPQSIDALLPPPPRQQHSGEEQGEAPLVAARSRLDDDEHQNQEGAAALSSSLPFTFPFPQQQHHHNGDGSGDENGYATARAPPVPSRLPRPLEEQQQYVTAALPPRTPALGPIHLPTHIEVKELEKAYDTLRKEYDKTSKNADAYRSEMRRLRAAKQEAGKQLASSQRMLEAVVRERRALQAQTEGQRDRIRRLEYRLGQQGGGQKNGGGNGGQLMEENRALRARLGEWEERGGEWQAALVGWKEERARLVREVEELREALRVRVDMARAAEEEEEGGMPMPLDGYGRSSQQEQQEERERVGDVSLVSASLFRQLAARKLEAKELVQSLVDAEGRVEGLKGWLERGKEALVAERRRRVDVETEMALVLTQLGRAGERVRVLEKRLKGLEGERRGLEGKVEEGRKVEGELVALKAEHGRVVARWKAQVEEMEKRVKVLQREKDALEGLVRKKEGERALAEEKLAEERRRGREAKEAAWAMEGEKGEWVLERRVMEEEVEALQAAVGAGKREREAAVAALAKEREVGAAMRGEMEAVLLDLRRANAERKRLEKAVKQGRERRMIEAEEEEEEEEDKRAAARQGSSIAAALAEELQRARRQLKEEAAHRRALEAEVRTHRALAAAVSMTTAPQRPPPPPQQPQQTNDKWPQQPVVHGSSALAPLSSSPSSSSVSSAFPPPPPSSCAAAAAGTAVVEAEAGGKLALR